jgi:alpha-beta hydrolase superfamily lysophospholipase
LDRQWSKVDFEPFLNVKDQAATPFPVPEASLSSPPESEIVCISDSEGEKLGGRIWRGRSDSPVLIYLHGIEGHSLWFARTAEYLSARNGISVYAIDRRGSGMNPEERGHVKNYHRWLADLHLILDRVTSDHPHQARFLMANCWGAKLATIVAQEGAKASTLNGLILTCPAIFTKPDVGLVERIKIALYCIFRRKEASVPMPIPLTASMFTDNQIYLDYIKNDRLRLMQARPQFFFENFWLGLSARKTAPALKLPVLLVQSGQDQIVDIPAVEKWFAKVKSVDKTFKMFADAHHSIDFDARCFEEYADLLVKWIADHDHAEVGRQ